MSTKNKEADICPPNIFLHQISVFTEYFNTSSVFFCSLLFLVYGRVDPVSVPADCSQTHWCWLALHCTVAQLLCALHTFCTVLISALHWSSVFQGIATKVRGSSSSIWCSLHLYAQQPALQLCCFCFYPTHCNCAARHTALDADSAESCRCTICKYAKTTTALTPNLIQVSSVFGVWECVFGIW